MYVKPQQTRDLKRDGRVILAWGEVSGHVHEVALADPTTDTPELPAVEYFEEPDGRRVLLVLQPVELKHVIFSTGEFSQDHTTIRLDPQNPIMVRQGDVLLKPLGPGAWEVIRQREEADGATRLVLD